MASKCNDAFQFESIISGLRDRVAILPIVLLLWSLSLTGELHAEQWTTHTNTSFVSGLASMGNELCAGTSGGAVLWDLATGIPAKITATEGLADQWVKDVYIDASGDHWYGTVAGVQKFDGVDWATYTVANSPLPSDVVYSIVQDLDGAMWFGTSYGCARFDGVDWDVYTDLGGGATNVAVRGIDVDTQNRIWTANNPADFGAPGGVSMFDGGAWTRHDPDPDTMGQYNLSLIVDSNDQVWVGSWTNWVFVYDGSSWTHYDSSNSGLIGRSIESFGLDSDNYVWIGNRNSNTTGGATRYDGSTWVSYTPSNSGMPDKYVYAIAASGDTVFFGTGANSIASFDGVTWRSLAYPGEPHSNWITSSTQGTLGAINGVFFGTDHYGVAVYDDGAWSSYTSLNSGLVDDFVNDLYLEDGILWVACQYTGVHKFNGSSWQNYNTGNSGLLGDIALSVDMDSQGVLWMGTAGWDGPMEQNGALAKFDGTTWTNYYLSNSGLIDDDNLKVAVDSDDIIWVGTEEGLSRFDGISDWTSYHTGNSGLVENHVKAIAFAANGDKWFGTLGGISRLRSGSWTSFTQADGLPSNEVRDINVSGETVWVATAAGAASYVEGEGWTAYTQTDGLGDNDVRSVEVLGGETIFFGTDESGISILELNPTGLSEPQEGESVARILVESWPNPFNPSTRISFKLPEAGRAALSIYDVSGGHVATLADGVFEAGKHALTWNGRSQEGRELPSGMYFVRVMSGSMVTTGKITLIK